MEPLSPIGCRALGSLLEKQLTVPATYPLTSNALVSACNQSTGRDPVMALSEAEVEAGVDELRRAGLVRLVHPSHGARMVKYRQVADEALGLDAAARALLTVLLLRGPQTAGELRSRSDRLHAFGSMDEIDDTLQRLAARDRPLVSARSRQPGQKEARWVHLLGATADETTHPEPTGTAVPPEVAALAPLIGTWVGAGEGCYPTITSFSYQEEIEWRPVPGKPLLAYRSATRAADDGRTLHGESGFLRLVGAGLVELVVAQGAGLVEIAEGLFEAEDHDGPSGLAGPAVRGELLLASTLVSGSSTAKQVSATERRYRVEGDRLTYDLAMAAVGHPLQIHLRAELTRR